MRMMIAIGAIVILAAMHRAKVQAQHAESHRGYSVTYSLIHCPIQHKSLHIEKHSRTNSVSPLRYSRLGTTHLGH